MLGFNFSQKLRAVLDGARAEAQRFHHEYIGTEHLLLALLRAEPNLATAVIESFGVKNDRLIAKAEEVMTAGRDTDTERADLPYTPRVTKVLQLSMAEARDLSHGYLGEEHLFLGLLREEKGVAAQVLASEGITLDASRARLLRILDERWPAEPFRQRGQRGGGLAAMTLWPKGEPAPRIGSTPTSMAASIIERLAQDAAVSAVFAAHGIDVAKLATALRLFSGPSA